MYRHYYKGKLVESSGDPYAKDLTVWEVLDKYADIRDELENLLNGFRDMQGEIEAAIYDLDGELEEVADHLRSCDRVFRRFRTIHHREEEYFTALQQRPDEEDGLPFDTTTVFS